VEIYYSVDKEEGSSYLWAWVVDSVTDCSISCSSGGNSESNTPSNTGTPTNTGTPSNTGTSSNTPTPSKSTGASNSNTPSNTPAPILNTETFGEPGYDITLLSQYTDAYFTECIDYVQAYYYKCPVNKANVDQLYWLDCGNGVCETVYGIGHQQCLTGCNDKVLEYYTYLQSANVVDAYNAIKSAWCFPVYTSSHNSKLELASAYWHDDFSICNIGLDNCYTDCDKTKSVCDTEYHDCLTQQACTESIGSAKRVVCEVAAAENDAAISSTAGTNAFNTAQISCGGGITNGGSGCTTYEITLSGDYISVEWNSCDGRLTSQTFYSWASICAETDTLKQTGGDGEIIPKGSCS
jgi:hypothetical protein